MSTDRIGKALYGALFILVWPAALAGWAWALDRQGFVTWDVPVPPALAIGAEISGFTLMAAAMIALWIHGDGLPMNAFPPKRLVEQSVYALFGHPIYVGFALMTFAAAALAGSRAGFWIVAPIAALSCVALVLGYERRDA